MRYAAWIAALIGMLFLAEQVAVGGPQRAMHEILACLTVLCDVGAVFGIGYTLLFFTLWAIRIRTEILERRARSILLGGAA